MECLWHISSILLKNVFINLYLSLIIVMEFCCIKQMHFLYYLNINVVYFFLFKTGCPPGHYGLDCKDNCSGHCINNEPCDHVSGVCPSGCQDGYTGARCNNSKIKNSWFNKYYAFFFFLKMYFKWLYLYTSLWRRVLRRKLFQSLFP